jgi:anti-sigma B factor antagonist
MEAIRIETDGLPPDTGVLVLDGELSIGTGVRIPLAVDEQLRDARTRLVIDLAGVEFIDSSGLSLLLNAQRRIQRAGGALAVVTPPERVRRVFEMTRLDRAFRLCETRDEALASLDQPLPLANESSG